VSGKSSGVGGERTSPNQWKRTLLLQLVLTPPSAILILHILPMIITRFSLHVVQDEHALSRADSVNCLYTSGTWKLMRPSWLAATPNVQRLLLEILRLEIGQQHDVDKASKLYIENNMAMFKLLETNFRYVQYLPRHCDTSCIRTRAGIAFRSRQLSHVGVLKERQLINDAMA
jgi:hypothetical protein